MERTLKDQAVIVGIGQTDFTKNSGRSELQLAVECVKAAVDDAGLSVNDIDGMSAFTLDTSDEIEIARTLGIPKLTFWGRIPYGGGAAVGIVHQAAMAVATGAAARCMFFHLSRMSWRVRSRSASGAAPAGSRTAGCRGSRSARRRRGRTP